MEQALLLDNYHFINLTLLYFTHMLKDLFAIRKQIHQICSLYIGLCYDVWTLAYDVLTIFVFSIWHSKNWTYLWSSVINIMFVDILLVVYHALEFKW
jgi:hypothetical protein